MDRIGIAILGILYANPGGLPEQEIHKRLEELDVENMSNKQWNAFHRKCARQHWWRKSFLYKWIYK